MSQLSENESYTIDAEGNLHFTMQGYKELKPLFAKAGININAVKNYYDYLIARERARPYFIEWLCEQIDEHNIDDATKDLFIELITNDQFDLSDAMVRYKRKQIKLVDNNISG
ncbi:MAG: hypothetical protein IPK77_09575 [Cellvibrio sp.]|nr:hypothetical protein [Cellvibrio sp.]